MNRRVQRDTVSIAISIAAIVSATSTVPPGGAAIEQTAPGAKPPATLVASFDGLGVGFDGPQGTTAVRNPSDNSLAVGPNHIVQIVNSRMAVFTKKGKQFDVTGRVLYGSVATNNVFRGFGGVCESRNNGDAVVRYDQLAERWLLVMPIFGRAAVRPDQPDPWTSDGRAHVSPPGRPNQPGPAVPLFRPPPPTAAQPAPAGRGGGRPSTGSGRAAEPGPLGPYSMCYAVSVGSDPLGAYYRYEFLRPLFPDYPRPAIWPDGYYVPTSTSDDPISDTITTQKHACVVDRAKMLRGEPATEQCIVIDNVNFLNNADVDGRELPPAGAPNVMMAAGGTQLKKIVEDTVIDACGFMSIGRTRRARRSRGPIALRWRHTATCAAGSSRTAFRNQAARSGSTRRATSSWRGSSIERLATASRSSPCTQWIRPRAAAASAGTSSESTKAGRSFFTNREPTRQTVSTVGWRVRQWTAPATSASAIRLAGRRRSPGSASRRALPATPSAS